MQKILDFLYTIFNVKKGEFLLLIYSILFIFVLFAGYSILRPIRDTLGLESGHGNFKWLFLATFVVCIIFSLLSMFIAGVVKKRIYLDCIYIFFGLNLVAFFVAMIYIPNGSEHFLTLCLIFYVWVSVFNMFMITTSWSLLVDVFNRDRSNRLFGIISAGASLGSIAGAAFVNIASQFFKEFDTHNYIFICIVFIVLGILLKQLIIMESAKLLNDKERAEFNYKFLQPVGVKNPFSGFSIIMKSNYLLALVGFIFLLTTVSTFLYIEQGRILEINFPKTMEGYKQARQAAFAGIDLIVQTLSFIIQIFFTSRIVKLFGIKSLLSIVGILVGFGFIALALTHPALLPLIIVMSIRRIGEYALVKPGREMLYVPLDSQSKYKVKNFIDVVVYRAGDAGSSQIEGLIAKLGVSSVLFSGAIICFVWGALGAYLGKKYEESEKP